VVGAPPFTIAEVSRATGIPVTTLRFYERELPELLRIQKTDGGHRRYFGEDIRRLTAIRRLTEEAGLRLSELRAIFRSGEADGEDSLRRRIEELETRVEELESDLREARRGGLPSLFRRRKRRT
jgi:DNA-binding transcriptional MerR regulator